MFSILSQVSVIAGLQAKLGYSCIPEACLPRLVEIAASVAETAAQSLSPSQPYVGSNAFAHKGGIHVAAVRKVGIQVCGRASPEYRKSYVKADVVHIVSTIWI